MFAIARRWLAQCVTLKDDTFKQLLLFAENAHDAADRIYQAIVLADPGEKRLLPIAKPYDTLGSTRYVSFDTIRPTYRTEAARCHVSHVVGDTESWEQKLAETPEDMPVKPPRPAPGLGKGGIIYMASDFDAPVEDMKGYME